MTVKELRKILEGIPGDAEVTVMATYDCGFCEAGGPIDEISTVEQCNDGKITEVELRSVKG